jgi:hypothetical protein
LKNDINLPACANAAFFRGLVIGFAEVPEFRQQIEHLRVVLAQLVASEREEIVCPKEHLGGFGEVVPGVGPVVSASSSAPIIGKYLHRHFSSHWNFPIISIVPVLITGS